MRRQICWDERLEDGTRREIRVAVQGRALKWQFKLSTSDRWDYDSPPTAADWDGLVERMENRYRRRNIAHDDLVLVQRLRRAAIEPLPDGSEPGPGAIST
jgi:hypothetical protein